MIYEACQEGQLSYEYRDGATSYGAFTFSMAKVLRNAERERVHLTFRQLARKECHRWDTLGPAVLKSLRQALRQESRHARQTNPLR